MDVDTDKIRQQVLPPQQTVGKNDSNGGGTSVNVGI